MTSTILMNELERRVRDLEGGETPKDGASLRNYNQRLRTARLNLARARGRHTEAEWEAIVAETAGICVRCGDKPPRLYKGHIQPVSLGGSDAIENIQPLCKFCVTAASREHIDWLTPWRETRTTTP